MNNEQEKHSGKRRLTFMRSEKSQCIASWSLLSFVAIIIGIFSYTTAWFGDDIRYAFFCDPNMLDIHIETFSDIIVSQNAHYFHVNGRYVAHVFVQLFCGILGHGWFAIANGLAYIAFFLILGRLCGICISNFKGMLSIVIACLLTFQTRMSPAFQINYIWMFTLSMTFIYIFFNKSQNRKGWQIMLLSLFSLVTGNGQEAINIGIGGALIIYWAMNMRKMNVTQYIMMVCFGLGALASCLSPGTLGRANGSADFSIIQTAYGLITNPFAIYILIGVVVWAKFKHSLRIKDLYRQNSFYFNIWFIQLLFALVIGIGFNRILFGWELISIIICFRILKRQSFTNIWLVSFAVLLSLTYFTQATFSARINHYIKDIDQQYQKSPDGTVYVDLDITSNISYCKLFVSDIFYFRYALYKDDYDCDFFEMLIRRHYSHKYPDKAPLRILPIYLKDKQHVKLKNQILEIHPNVYLCIHDKEQPQKYYVDRNIDLCGITKTYPPLEVELTREPAAEGDTWEAYFINGKKYGIYYVSDEVFYSKDAELGSNYDGKLYIK